MAKKKSKANKPSAEPDSLIAERIGPYLYRLTDTSETGEKVVTVIGTWPKKGMDKLRASKPPEHLDFSKPPFVLPGPIHD